MPLAGADRIIVLLAMPRSGTHFLRAAIAAGSANAAGGAIVNLDEPFNPDLGDRPYRFDRFLRARIAADPGWRMDARTADAVLADYFDLLAAQGNGRRVLVDIKDDELRILEWPATLSTGEPRLLRHILKAGYPVLRVERRDMFAQYLSVQRAMATGEWVLTGRDSTADPRLTIDDDRARRHMLLTALAARAVRRWIEPQPRVLRLAYETMIEGGRLAKPAHAALEAFLGCRLAVPPDAALPRKLAAPPERLAANFAAIRARLAADGLDWICDLDAPQYADRIAALAPPLPA